MALRSLTARCPAKINLTLRIAGRRDDGFHELESWVAQVGLYDELTVDAADEVSLTVIPHGAAPTDETNLVMKAARLLAETTQTDLGAAINLRKEIPSGAGLGGGSSNAAGALRLLNELWQTQLDDASLTALAAKLGSDVPLFLHERQVIMRGRGELVEEHAAPSRGWVVLILPAIEVPTAAVYQAYAQQQQGKRSDAGHATVELQHPPSSAAELMPQLFNDLEPAAFDVEPKLVEIHHQVNQLNGRVVRMTGSGSAFFSLFDTEADATAWAEAARDCVATTTRLVVVPVLTA